MRALWTSIGLPVRIVGITILLLAFIAVYQWGYITCKKQK